MYFVLFEICSDLNDANAKYPRFSPNKLLRSFPALNAEQIKRTTLAIISMIPDDIYEEIVIHAR
jgi:hypothetical protein